MARLILPATEVAQHLADAGFVGFQVIRMGQIAMAESGLDAYAVNVVDRRGPAYRSLDVGLTQINSHWAAKYFDGLSTLLDPATNTKVAHAIFVDRGGARDPRDGYTAWTAYNNGTYARWQTMAVAAAKAIGAWPA